MVASIAQLTSAATSVSYYARDGQVREDDPEHRLASSWHGMGARALGLAGPVDAESFQAVLEGHVPGTGLRLGSIRKGQHRHRPGVDLVFSAPKSVALEALFEGDERVVDAHDHAAKEALDWIEERFLETRGFDRETGRRPRVRADQLVAATFRHVASRNHDPQIHTHCAPMVLNRNLTIGTYNVFSLANLHRKCGNMTFPFPRCNRNRRENHGDTASHPAPGRRPQAANKRL